MYKYTINKDMKSVVWGLVLVFVIITIGIIYSSNILKEETIEKQLTITRLNTSFISKDLNQHMNNMELFIENITSVISLLEDEKVTNKKLKGSLKRFPLIRSINILDEEKIIYSSNELNIGLIIEDYNFYPKPLFSNNILRVSYPWIGRDFVSGTNTLASNEILQDKLSFIPILKTVYIDDNKFSIIINLNSEYILNIFDSLTKYNEFKIELLRLDNILLLSDDRTAVLGKQYKSSNFYEDAIASGNNTGIEEIHNTKYISSYSVLKDYPFMVTVHLDYNKSLSSWNEKRNKFFIITISTVILCIFAVLIMILLYRKAKEEEILGHKQQIEDQEKFKYLFEDSHFITAVLDQKGKILEINNSALKFLGFEKRDSINLKLFDFNCWKNTDKRFIKRLFKNKHPHINIKRELQVFDKFKKDAFLDVSLFTINRNSEDYKYIAIAQDITERKNKEKRLKQSYTVFNNTKDGIVITDKYTNIVDVNRSFELITGYEKKDILNRNTTLLKSNKHPEEFYKKMWKAIDEFGFWEGEIINSKKNSDLFTEWLTINVILDKNGSVINYIGIFSDITKEKQKEALLKEKESVIFHQSKMAAMGEMIENIAHQWRQPLSIISVAATGMKIKKEFGLLTDEEENKNLDMINESAQYLSCTIDDFRDFLKQDKELAMFDLEETISSALKLISSKLKNRNIQTINNNKKVSINGLRNEVIQVLINILNNARDALEECYDEKKFIFISSYKDSDYAVIKIQDTAHGIPQDILDRIFEPYFTTKHKSQGTGIGLYMSEQIIKNHLNGLISAQNVKFEYENETYTGACFEIKIPLNYERDDS